MSDRTQLRVRAVSQEIVSDMGSASDWMAGGGIEDILGVLYSEGHVPAHLAAATNRLLSDMRTCHGTSAGLTIDMDRVGGGSNGGKIFLGGYVDLLAFERVETVLKSLHPHQRQALAYLITHKEKARGALKDFGRSRSSFAQDKTCRAFAIGVIVSLLNSIADGYALTRS